MPDGRILLVGATNWHPGEDVYFARLVTNDVPACMAVRTSCRRSVLPGKGKLVIKDRPLDAKDLLVWNVSTLEDTELSALGNPLLETDYAFCIYEGVSRELTFSGFVPADVPGIRCGTRQCWKGTGTSGYAMRDKSGNPEGITKVKLRAGLGGRAKIIVKGSGERLTTRPVGLPPPPLQLPLLVQLQASNGECWETAYSAAIRNETGLFKAKAD